ncbi:hypothetical protein LIA77_01786 [Sarocladium implicatum]|nr:hypothetical protein LIA77_01786 [Sarocladium implicatum]
MVQTDAEPEDLMRAINVAVDTQNNLLSILESGTWLSSVSTYKEVDERPRVPSSERRSTPRMVFRCSFQLRKGRQSRGRYVPSFLIVFEHSNDTQTMCQSKLTVIRRPSPYSVPGFLSIQRLPEAL